MRPGVLAQIRCKPLEPPDMQNLNNQSGSESAISSRTAALDNDAACLDCPVEVLTWITMKVLADSAPIAKLNTAFSITLELTVTC